VRRSDSTYALISLIRGAASKVGRLPRIRVDPSPSEPNHRLRLAWARLRWASSRASSSATDVAGWSGATSANTCGAIFANPSAGVDAACSTSNVSAAWRCSSSRSCGSSVNTLWIVRACSLLTCPDNAACRVMGWVVSSLPAKTSPLACFGDICPTMPNQVVVGVPWAAIEDPACSASPTNTRSSPSTRLASFWAWVTKPSRALCPSAARCSWLMPSSRSATADNTAPVWQTSAPADTGCRRAVTSASLVAARTSPDRVPTRWVSLARVGMRMAPVGV